MLIANLTLFLPGIFLLWSFCTDLDLLPLESTHHLQTANWKHSILNWYFYVWSMTGSQVWLLYNQESCAPLWSFVCSVESLVIINAAHTQVKCGITLLFLDLAWSGGKGQKSSQQHLLSLEWSHLPRTISYTVCLQVSLHKTVLTRALEDSGAALDGLEAGV